MATVPVTPKKEGRENYFPQQRNYWQKKFSIFISAIQYPRHVVLWKELIQFVSIIVIFSCKSGRFFIIYVGQFLLDLPLQKFLPRK